VKNKISENVTTLISRATEIVGDLKFSGALEVEGNIKGNIIANPDAPAEIRIRESGYVQGEIRVPTVIINGKVEGAVYSSEHIELAAKARVVGNVYYNLIEMVMGSEVNGSLCHRTGEEFKPKQVEKPTMFKTERNPVVVEAAVKASA
jgi:cytoskeletal protein CcmA (bactofilin family)